VVVGVARISLYFPKSSSLKVKRQGLRKIIDRVRAKFNAAVAEVSEQDQWQRSAIGVTVVGNESRHVQSMLDNIISFVDELYVAPILDRQTDLLTYSDEEPMDERPMGDKL
jgi:uncharacterized protein YlxP (DUF503 family)